MQVTAAGPHSPQRVKGARALKGRHTQNRPTSVCQSPCVPLQLCPGTVNPMRATARRLLLLRLSDGCNGVYIRIRDNRTRSHSPRRCCENRALYRAGHECLDVRLILVGQCVQQRPLLAPQVGRAHAMS